MLAVTALELRNAPSEASTAALVGGVSSFGLGGTIAHGIICYRPLAQSAPKARRAYVRRRPFAWVETAFASRTTLASRVRPASADADLIVLQSIVLATALKLIAEPSFPLSLDSSFMQAGMDSVHNRCVKIEHARLFGGLNWVGVNTGIISARRLV